MVRLPLCSIRCSTLTSTLEASLTWLTLTQGCCASRPRGDQHDQQPSATSHPLTPTAPRNPSLIPSSSVSVATSTDAAGAAPLGELPNLPLQPYVWQTKPSQPALKRSRWLAKREAFFHTAVTNRPEIWAALKATVEEMDKGDFASAQGILDACEITLPHGDLHRGAYDKFGNIYKLPSHAISAPTNMIEDDKEPASKEVETSTAGTYKTLDPAASTQSDKGKSVASNESIQVTARLSDRSGSGQDVVVTMMADEPTQVLIGAVAEKAGLPKEKIRIAYMGKVLKANKGVVAQGWQRGHVVNAMVT